MSHARDFNAHDAGFVGQRIHKLHAWMERRRRHRALQALDDRLLDDIGVSREAAASEASKPSWRAYTRRHLE